MENTRSKQTLKALLSFIRDCETEKPLDEINTGVVEACVKLLLKLDGKEVAFTTEQIKEKVRNIPFVISADFDGEAKKKTKKHTNTKKILLVAAIIAVLCAVLAVFSIGYNLDYWHGIMNEKFGSVHNMSADQNLIEGKEEAGYLGKPIIYKSTDEFYNKENYDVLLPDKLPNGIELIDVQVIKKDNTIFVSLNDVITAYEININSPLPQELIDISNETVFINNLTCYICRFDDINTVQIYFEHNGNYYSIGGTNEQILLDIIGNLEEYK